MRSFFGSMTKTAPGNCSIRLMPMSVLLSLSISRSSLRTSFFEKASNLPVAFMSSSCLRREMLLVMVWKFVRVPPSQRRFTKYMPARCDSSATISAACFLVPTNRTVPPWAARSLTKRCASSNFFNVF